ncbi:MAG: hypothetical protein ACRD3F_00695 [Acidobacteriaceae bacterium]
MRASRLQQDHFQAYPPEARNLAVAHIDLFRRLPTIFVATLLREVIDYDWRFPDEREAVDRQLNYLDSLPPPQIRELFAKFAAIRLDSNIEQMDWAKNPALFSEKLTGFLWSTHQIDAFRIAATEYMSALLHAAPAAPLPLIPRLAIAVIGKGVKQSPIPLFRKLRPHGVLFTEVQPENGLQVLTDAVSQRATAHPVTFGHFYIDGGTAWPVSPKASTIAYDALRPVRSALLRKMRQMIQSGSGGPEMLRTTMAAITPEELGMRGSAADGVLDRFQIALLAQGSGTQIFSTTFVQWGAREALRRAQPVTLLARFTPRQRQRPMNELLEGDTAAQLDPEGSLLDADMGAYYIWLDQQRLSGAEQSSFIAWFEDHNQALAIGPSLPRGTVSTKPATMKQLMQWIT